MKFKKIAAMLLTATMVIASFAACAKAEKTTDANASSDDSSSSSNEESSTPEESTSSGLTVDDVELYDPDTVITDGYGLTENVADGTILHCFSWSFNTITAAMDDIALAGYSTIQTSPINLCNDGGDAGIDLFGSGKWYYHYQPTDWTIGNYQLGTEEEFKKMCEAAEAHGINVIVDVVPNHTTKATDTLSKDFLNAVGGMGKLYHSNGLTEITNYGDRAQCTLQAMGGLYDVDTENPDFQDYFISFLNKCIDYGVDGFRYDTAKHIGLADDPKDADGQENNFWERVTTEINNADSIFNYGEVLQGDGERIADYIDVIGATTASNYGANIRNALIVRNITASKVTNFSVGGSNSVVTWVESHDNYTEENGTASKLDNTDITLGWAVIAARGEGTPLFFSRPYGATADSMWGTFNKIGMVGDDLYKDATIVAINRFRNAMVGESENFFNPNDEKTLLFIERGEKGLVIINASSSSEHEFSVETSLADGNYVNRVDKATVYTVKDGVISGKIGKDSVVVLYNENFVLIGDAAVVKVADSTTSSIMGESIEVTLEAANVESATYSIDSGEAVEYKNGDVITVGADIDVLETTTLTLTGTNSEGKTSIITYIFKKIDAIAKGTTISFKKPDSWGSTVNAYVYDETTSSSVITNASWPGVAMTDNGDGTYTYTFTEDWIAPLVIFNDGTNQSPGAMEPGHEVIPGNLYSAD